MRHASAFSLIGKIGLGIENNNTIFLIMIFAFYAKIG